MTDNITFDQVRTGDAYNLISLYEGNDGDNIQSDSPFQYCNTNCDYFDPNQFQNSANELCNAITYLHLNCRGLSSNWESFQELLCDIHTEIFAFDLIGLSEVFNCDIDSRLSLPGYHKLITQNREDGTRGGVALFIKDNIYRPNTAPKADIDIFSPTMSDILSLINIENKYGVIMGDMNIDLLKFESHTKTNEYIENIFSHGFIPMISKPTRVTPSSATLIDHIITNNINCSNTSGIIINDVAGHFGIFHASSVKSTKASNKYRQVRSCSENNLLKFKSLLDNIDFSQIYQMDCPNKAFDEFIRLYENAFEKAFPLCSVRPNKKCIRREPWVTQGLLTSSRKKAKLLVKKLKTPTEHNINYYKTFNQVFNKSK